MYRRGSKILARHRQVAKCDWDSNNHSSIFKMEVTSYRTLLPQTRGDTVFLPQMYMHT